MSGLFSCSAEFRSRSRKESEVFGWSRIPNNTGSRSRIFFVRLQLRGSDWIIFYITLLNWEFLLKWYNFFLKLLLKQRLLAVHHDFHWFLQPNFIPWCLGVEVGNFGKVGVGVGYFTSDSATQVFRVKMCFFGKINNETLLSSFKCFFPSWLAPPKKSTIFTEYIHAIYPPLKIDLQCVRSGLCQRIGLVHGACLKASCNEGSWPRANTRWTVCRHRSKGKSLIGKK